MKTKLPPKLQALIDARKKFRLSHIHIQMAMELGMNPKKFGKLGNNKQEPWKAQLPDFIEDIYFKRFSKLQPDEVKTIEKAFASQTQKKQQRKLAKRLNPANSVSSADSFDDDKIT